MPQPNPISARPRVAVIGTGIAGLTCAWNLRHEAEVILFDRERPGGHTNTVTINEAGRELPIDTGFIVFNKVTYPNLCHLFDELGVTAKPSEMSLSVRHLPRGLEYNGMGFNKLFAQRRNLTNPRFYAFVSEIMRFFRVGRRWLADEASGDTSGEHTEFDGEDLATFCKRHRFGADFLDLYLVPMSSAVWSTEPGRILDFPAATLLHFFHNHGFLGVTTHHPWFTVEGGSRSYLSKMLDVLGMPRLGDPVISVAEEEGASVVTTASGTRERFDAVVLAAHADQSLSLLSSPTETQRRLLSRFTYQQNETLLHTDSTVMPARRLAWASWNFRVDQPTGILQGVHQGGHHRATTHYWMNALQGVSKNQNYFVSLNSGDLIDPASVLYHTTYEHPVFTLEAIRAQRELPALNHSGGRLFFCGSYFRYGFHEDACTAGLDAAYAVLRTLKNSQGLRG
jgi:predicted NAD/FAD-binding protein